MHTLNLAAGSCAARAVQLLSNAAAAPRNAKQQKVSRHRGWWGEQTHPNARHASNHSATHQTQHRRHFGDAPDWAVKFAAVADGRVDQPERSVTQILRPWWIGGS